MSDAITPEATRDYLADIARELARMARDADHKQSACYFELARLSLLHGGEGAPGKAMISRWRAKA